MYMKLTWTTILIFDVHFDVQFNGTPLTRDAVLNFEPLTYVYIISFSEFIYSPEPLELKNQPQLVFQHAQLA